MTVPKLAPVVKLLSGCLDHSSHRRVLAWHTRGGRPDLRLFGVEVCGCCCLQVDLSWCSISIFALIVLDLLQNVLTTWDWSWTRVARIARLVVQDLACCSARLAHMATCMPFMRPLSVHLRGRLCTSTIAIWIVWGDDFFAVEIVSEPPILALLLLFRLLWLATFLLVWRYRATRSLGQFQIAKISVLDIDTIHSFWLLPVAFAAHESSLKLFQFVQIVLQ